MGRHRAEFTEREVGMIKEMAAHGLHKNAIASALGITRQTLDTYFFTEIAAARHEGKQRVLDMLWYKARTSDIILKHLADRILGPVKQNTTITLEDVTRKLEITVKSRGIELPEALKALGDGECDDEISD